MLNMLNGTNGPRRLYEISEPPIYTPTAQCPLSLQQSLNVATKQKKNQIHKNLNTETKTGCHWSRCTRPVKQAGLSQVGGFSSHPFASDSPKMLKKNCI